MPGFRQVLAGAVVAAALVIASTAPAVAHDELNASSPSAGEQLPSAPTSVTLQFTADVLPLGAIIIVADAAGKDWTAAQPTISGADASAPLAEGMPGGAYEIRWRVVSSDGHPISGAIPFRVAGAPPVSSEHALPPATTSVSPPPISSERSPAGATDDQIAALDSSPLRLVLIGAGGAIVALVALVLIQFLRRRKRSGDVHSPDAPGERDHS